MSLLTLLALPFSIIGFIQLVISILGKQFIESHFENKPEFYILIFRPVWSIDWKNNNKLLK